ncbi:hypothetical protein [Pseudogulbenkiania subflava]|uniref:Uncharacterized protein n=1 Tax=Pseudogulbenkiania subflava DSM 22618 TaxID=1123014 RepID=A0A1Y6BQM4_9NEIS|nr:hypothetical protein [Pseudogulbenkiania subflava]SMF16008.1 hypothetical protein SAMN02745746_01629 [Pseudogulbenkiania subflava DSM 22618]
MKLPVSMTVLKVAEAKGAKVLFRFFDRLKLAFLHCGRVCLNQG